MSAAWPVFAAACLLLLGGCTAPLVQDVGDSGPGVLGAVDRARRVEITTDDGCTLRGVFVEAASQGPIVLHLLPSSVSVATGIPTGFGRHTLATTLETFAGDGWSSLALDYRGLGDSEGSPRADRLRADGNAMWQAAVEMAGGDESRVLIRAGSLGTLIAVDLLRRGARPGGVIMIAPIRAESVVSHGAARRLGEFLGHIAAMFYARPIGSGLCDVLREIDDGQVPMLLMLPEVDRHVRPAELAMIAKAARDGGHAVLETDEDHPTLVLRSWGFTVDRHAYSGSVTRELIEAESSFLRRVAGPTGPSRTGPWPGDATACHAGD